MNAFAEYEIRAHVDNWRIAVENEKLARAMAFSRHRAKQQRRNWVGFVALTLSVGWLVFLLVRSTNGI